MRRRLRDLRSRCRSSPAGARSASSRFMRRGGAPPYDDTDAELAVEVARRAALALDNARLFAELRRTEGQLEAVLGQPRRRGDRPGARRRARLRQPGRGARCWAARRPTRCSRRRWRELLDAFVVLDEDGPARSTCATCPGATRWPARSRDPALTHTIVKATGEERWSLTKATPVRDEHGAVVLAVNIIEDVTDARLAERQQRFLSAASMLVSSSLDIDVTLDKVAARVVPELADWCCVDVPDERGVVRRAAIAAGARDRDALDAHARRAVDGCRRPGLARARAARPGARGCIGDFDDGRRARVGRRRRRGGRRAAGQRHALGDGRPAHGRRPRHRRRDARDRAQRAAAGRGRAGAGRRARAPRRHRGRERAPARRAHAHRHHAAAQPAAAAAAGRAGRDHRGALPRRRRDERGRRRLLRPLRRRRRVDGRRRRRDRQGAGRRHDHRRWRATRCARRRCTSARRGAVLARLNAALGVDPERRQICTAVCARIEPAPDGTRGRQRSRAAAIPPPFLPPRRAAPRPSARRARCSAPSTAARGRRPSCVGAGEASSSTPTASPTRAARAASRFGAGSPRRAAGRRRGARRRRGRLAHRRRAAGLRGAASSATTWPCSSSRRPVRRRRRPPRGRSARPPRTAPPRAFA